MKMIESRIEKTLRGRKLSVAASDQQTGDYRRDTERGSEFRGAMMIRRPNYPFLRYLPGRHNGGSLLVDARKS